MDLVPGDGAVNQHNELLLIVAVCPIENEKVAVTYIVGDSIVTQRLLKEMNFFLSTETII